MSNVKILTENPFQILLLEPGDINHLDWNKPDYIQTIISMPFIKTFEVKPNTLFDKIYELLNIINDKEKLIMTETISDEPNYMYEIIYINTLNRKTDLIHNELATMLHMENEKIYGNCIVIKSHLPINNFDMILYDMTSSELYKIIKRRGFTQVVVWDDSWREEEFYGDLENYAKKLFENEKYKRCEIAFLTYNVNIWYVPSEFGTKNICGSFIKEPIEKCFVFTMITNTIRGCISKDEINKIFKLSEILEPPYKPDNKWFEEEQDEHGRKIIKNKYRILDNVYQEKCNK